MCLIFLNWIRRGIIIKSKILTTSLFLIFNSFFIVNVNATNDIVTSLVIENNENLNYDNQLVSSFYEKEILYDKKEEKKFELNDNLSKQLESISNLENLIINNSSKNLYIYKETNKDSEIVGVLSSNSIGEVTDIRTFENEIEKYLADEPEWYYIKSGDYSGYIKNEDLLKGEKAINKLNNIYEKILKVTANSVRVRREQNTESDIIDVLSSNTIVNINVNKYEKGMDWIPVIINEEEGYIKSNLVEVVDKVNFATKYEKPKPKETKKIQKIMPPSSESPSAVVEYAKQFLGNPYVWGGTSLTNGADCSGFVMKVYEAFGVSLPHSSYSDRFVGKAVAYNEIQPGDIVCYDGHVGIYAGNGQIINALNKRKGITMTDVNYDTVLAVRRVLE